MTEQMAKATGGLGALLPARVWADLHRAGTRREFGRGAVLVREGAPAIQLFVLLTGRVTISRCTEGGEAVIAVRGPGEVIGDLSFLDGGTRSATVTAASACVTRALTAVEFRSFVAKHDVGRLVSSHVCARLREGEALRLEFATMPVLQRVAVTLWRLRADSGRGRSVIDISQDELAGLVGASRNRVVEALTTLRSAALVRTSRRRIEIVNPEGLRQMMTRTTAVLPDPGRKGR